MTKKTKKMTKKTPILNQALNYPTLLPLNCDYFNLYRIIRNFQLYFLTNKLTIVSKIFFVGFDAVFYNSCIDFC